MWAGGQRAMMRQTEAEATWQSVHSALLRRSPSYSQTHSHTHSLLEPQRFRPQQSTPSSSPQSNSHLEANDDERRGAQDVLSRQPPKTSKEKKEKRKTYCSLFTYVGVAGRVHLEHNGSPHKVHLVHTRHRSRIPCTPLPTLSKSPLLP